MARAVASSMASCSLTLARREAEEPNKVARSNAAIARELPDNMASGRDPDEIANLFAPNLVFEILGDDGVLPWIGRGTDIRLSLTS